MTQERPCGRGATYKPGREASPETNRDGAFVLDFSLQNCEKIKALQLAKQQPYPQSWAFAHTATPIPAPPALLWQPLPRMQPQGPALRRPPGLPSPHVVLLSVPATSIPAASVPAACTLSPALQGSGGQDTTVCGSSRSRQPATAAAGRCHQGYTFHGAGRSPAPSELQACNFCSHPSCNCRSEPSCGLPGQAGSTRARQRMEKQPETG
ncbi:uncharacterized protein LOC111549068 isoform X3 [Piliocolobus tephrosceles]|uniref:uncharacterized protein LOC111549068 isoform X3 n=1 Tax=Piliocolobus tephrosceles TaxID=591936 RepID=UPI000E6AFCB1|nr:uncharacterized protein LOC111549068 isoform X3 [Piliocolobus tephrosceles]